MHACMSYIILSHILCVFTDGYAYQQWYSQCIHKVSTICFQHLLLIYVCPLTAKNVCLHQKLYKMSLMLEKLRCLLDSHHMKFLTLHRLAQLCCLTPVQEDNLIAIATGSQVHGDIIVYCLCDSNSIC